MAPSGSLIHALIRHLWPRNSMARLLGELGILFVLLPRILWCWMLGVFCARFPPRADDEYRRVWWQSARADEVGQAILSGTNTTQQTSPFLNFEPPVYCWKRHFPDIIFQSRLYRRNLFKRHAPSPAAARRSTDRSSCILESDKDSASTSGKPSSSKAAVLGWALSTTTCRFFHRPPYCVEY